MLSVLFFHYCYGSPVFKSGVLRIVWFLNNSIFLGTNYAFFFISGYRMRLRDPKKYFKMQFNEIKGMYCWTAVASVVLYFIMWGLLTYDSLYVLIKESVQLGAGFLFGAVKAFKLGRFLVQYVGPMWFLLTAFWAQIYVNTLLKSKYAKHGWWILSLAMLIVVFLQIPFPVMGILSGVIFSIVVYAGYRAKERKLLDRIRPRQVLILSAGMLAVQTALYLMTGKDLEELYLAVPAYYIVYFPVGFLWGIVLCYFGLQLNGSDAKILEWIATIGRYSSYVFCVHTVDYLAIPWYRVSEIMGLSPVADFIVIIMLRCTFVLLGCLLVSYIVRNKWELKEKIYALTHPK